MSVKTVNQRHLCCVGRTECTVWLVERSGWSTVGKKKRLAGDRLSKESEPDKTLTFTLKDVWGVIYLAYLKTKLSPLS